MKNMILRNGSIFALVALLLISAASLHAQQQEEPYQLAVYTAGIDDNGQLPTTMISIAQNKAITALTATGKYKMIERSYEFLKKVQQEQEQQASGDVADNQISEIGASCGAEKICVVSVSKIGNNYLYVATRIVDVKLKTSFEAGDAENDAYKSPSDLTKCVEAAITNMLGGIISSPSRTSARGNVDFTVGGVTFKMVYVEGGTFTMGCTSEQGSECDEDEKPAHRVTLSSYYMGETEVTQALWEAVMGNDVYAQRDKANTQWPMRGVGPDYPMYYVSWNEVQEFIRKLNQLTGKTFRLPTEAEWEYAARGGNKSRGYKYAGSNYVDDVAWYDGNSSNKTHPVKGKQPNELGLYDMSGNVWEWCSDWYGSYSSDSQTDPRGAYSGTYRVDRGGSWGSIARCCRSAIRDYSTPDGRYGSLGFRLSLQD